MAGHAKLSPSSAERWTVCPGSVVLSQGMPNPESPYAAEGTKAHALAECWLKGQNPTDKWFVSADAREMRDYVNVYTSFVRDLTDIEPETILHVEQQVAVSVEVYGTADAIVWQPTRKHLHVVDLKYGAGVAVEVVNNLQLKIYGLAALLTMNYDAETVTVHIVQPRCPHRDGPIRSVSYDAVDLVEFFADIEDAVARVAEATDAYGA